MLGSLVDPDDMYTRLDPAHVAEALQPALETQAETVVDRVVAEHYPRLWERVPTALRARAMARIRDEIPQVVERLMVDIHRDLDSYFDLRGMVVDAFVRNKNLINEFFWRCGGRELRFIVWSGLGLGLLFGLVQMGLWLVWQPWWLLPLAGLMVGCGTNWLAIRMIFEPAKPRRIGPVVWQGLFLKRQAEVSAEYARLFAEEVFSPENLTAKVLEGPAGERLIAMVARHVEDAIDESVGRGKAVLELAAGSARYEAMRRAIARGMAQQLPESVAAVHGYAEHALDIDNTLRRRLEKLPPDDFIGILRPIFEEDEWILITVGAILGAIAGFLQLTLLFGG
jgi:uncharacterized membrane protein YheB (UPF0754 family)